MKSVWRVLLYLKRYRLMFAAQLFCAVASVSCVLIFPEVLKNVIGDVIPNKDYERFTPLVLLTLVGFISKEGLNAARIVINNHFEQRVIFDIRSDLYQRIQRLPVKWFDGRRTGDVMTRVTEDVTAMERVLIDGVEQGLMAVSQILIIGGWIYYQNLYVGLWASFPIPLLLLGAWFYTRNASKRYKEPREASSNMNALLHDNIAGIRQIKSFTAERAEWERFNEHSNKLRKANLKVMSWWAGYSPGMALLSMTGFTLVLWQGGHKVMDGSLELEAFVGVFFLLYSFYEPINKLHYINQMALSSKAAADRVFEILDADEEEGIKGGSLLKTPVQGAVSFSDVSFSYGDQKTLTDLTLEVPAGHTIALVGPTGAGKSTIVNLLSRFYEVSEGAITIDGVNIKDCNKKSLRSAIGYVSQDNFLFNSSVMDNMTIAKPDASEQDVWDALEAAQATQFVKRLPEGLETNIGERGVKLSGGEQQRLAIARAILKNPPLLILDEATASVDNETEELIQNALNELLKGRTAIVIAHRLTTVQKADCIYVLDRGCIVESGTHNQLIEQKGLYADLAKKSAN